jgi:hypothetical protein
MTRLRTIYVMRSAVKEQDARPSVYIDMTKGGELCYGVRASGSSLKRAREKAQAEFWELMVFVDQAKSGQLTEAMKKLLVRVK